MDDCSREKGIRVKMIPAEIMMKGDRNFSFLFRAPRSMSEGMVLPFIIVIYPRGGVKE
jgi:hypothetical protein